MSEQTQVLTALQRVVDVHANYVEIVFLDPLSSDCAVDGSRSFHMDDSAFECAMNAVKGAGKYRYTRRSCKEVHCANAYLELNARHEARVYKKILADAVVCAEGDASLMVIGYDREKASYHTFPATTKSDSESFVNTVTFRVNNRVFINFERRTYEDGASFNKVFINYKHDANVDLPFMMSAVMEAVQATKKSLS